MHSAYPTPHQEYYIHASHFIKTCINRNIPEQEIRRQFVPNSTQRRNGSTTSHKYLISSLCISITTWETTTLKQPRPLLDSGNPHKHSYKRSKRCFTITSNHELLFCILSTFSHFKIFSRPLCACPVTVTIPDRKWVPCPPSLFSFYLEVLYLINVILRVDFLCF